MMSISPPHSLKRSAEDLGELQTTPAKRRRLYHRYHAVRHQQQAQVNPSHHTQDERLCQEQLKRGISVALSSAGFSSARPEALEMVRSQTEEYMLHFLSTVKESMASSRRSQALPQDFTRALSHHNVTSLDLFPQLTVPVPPLLAQQPVLGPIPDEPPPKNLEAILGNELSGRAENQQRNYIPRHFPCLPSKHTWQSTPVFPAREEDPRKIRERATEEGVLAEQALRKLMAAKKSGSQKRRPLGEVQQSSVEVQRRQVWEDALQAVMKEDEQERKRYEEADIEGGWEIDEANGDRDGAGVMKPDIGMLVNYDRKYWRKGAQERIAQV